MLLLIQLLIPLRHVIYHLEETRGEEIEKQATPFLVEKGVARNGPLCSTPTSFAPWHCLLELTASLISSLLVLLLASSSSTDTASQYSATYGGGITSSPTHALQICCGGLGGRNQEAQAAGRREKTTVQQRSHWRQMMKILLLKAWTRQTPNS